MKKLIFLFLMAVGLKVSAQTFTQYTTTEQQPWRQKGKVKAHPQPLPKGGEAVCFQVTESPSLGEGKGVGSTFKAWGTCFNELDLDAIRLLTKDEQEKIMHDIFAPDGDLRYTPEYYAYKHFSHFVEPGSTLLAFYPIKDGLQAIVFQRPDGKRVIICGNTNNEATPLSIQLGKRYLNATLSAHSFNTFVEK